MTDTSENELVQRLAAEHSISTDAVSAVLEALRRGGGRMAQFSHADFGGMSQWSAGMTMVGDMFNDGLKAKLDAIATELAAHLGDLPAERQPDEDVSYRSSAARSPDWWPQGLGRPDSVGSQNDMRYAIFGEARRLVIDDHGQVTIYDTGERRISGIAQAQSSTSTLKFTSQNGLVRVAELREVDR